MSTLFDHFVRHNGGAAYYQNPEEGRAFAKLATLLASCRARALAKISALCSYAAAYRLEVGWIMDGNFNAIAGIQDGVDCIGINLGVVHRMRNLFLGMLSHPQVLTNIGNSRLEQYRESYIPKDAVTDLHDFSAVVIPCDRLRLQYSSRLFSCVFNFIFQHEFWHLF